jgi:chromate transporter
MKRSVTPGLINSWAVVCIALLTPAWSLAGELVHVTLDANWRCILLALAILVCTRLPKLKDLHPIVWIALSAAAGIAFGL